MSNDLNKIEQEIARLKAEHLKIITEQKSTVLADINEKILAFGIQPKELKFGPAPKRGRKPGTKLDRTQVKAMFARDAAKKKSNGIEKVKPEPKGNGKLPPKYQLGDHTWSGKARKPKWIQEHLAKGGTLAAIQVQ